MMVAKWESSREQISKSKAKARKRVTDEVPKHIVQREDDHGRQSVYDYELKVYRELRDSRNKFYAIEPIQKLCKEIMEDPRVKAVDPYPDEPYIIQETWGKTANARVWERRIRFPLPSSNFSVLHEIAHLLTPGNSHGRQFMEMEAKLFGWFVGEEAETIMLQEINKIYLAG